MKVVANRRGVQEGCMELAIGELKEHHVLLHALQLESVCLWWLND